MQFAIHDAKSAISSNALQESIICNYYGAYVFLLISKRQFYATNFKVKYFVYLYHFSDQVVFQFINILIQILIISRC